MRTCYRPARSHPSTKEAMAGEETLHRAIAKRQEEKSMGVNVLNGREELLGELKARLTRWKGRRRHGRIDIHVNLVAGEIADFRIEEGPMTDGDWDRLMRERRAVEL